MHTYYIYNATVPGKDTSFFKKDYLRGVIVDAAILRDFKAGRIEPFYRNAYASLYLFAEGILGPDCSFLAEDCVQDAILRSYERRKSLKTPESWQSFLFVNVHNNCVSILRKHGSYQRYLDAVVEEEFERDSLYRMIESEAAQMLSERLAELPENLRETYELCFVQGLGNQEVANKKQLSLSGLKKQKRQLLELIEKSLTEY